MTRPLLLVIPPEYFPTPLTAACMLHADEIILLDTAQYSRQSFQNRTLIRNPDGSQWLTIPVDGGQFGDPIYRTGIHSAAGWRRQHDKALRFNYSTSPFYEHFRPRLDPIFEDDASMLGDVTCRAMLIAADLLGCRAPVRRASALAGQPATVPDVTAPRNEWTVLFPHTIPSSEAGPGPIAVCSLAERAWRQNFEGFVSGTGSLDLLFNLGPDARGHLLADSRLELTERA